MDDGSEARTDLGKLLDAVESAAPMDAVDVLANELARMVGATDVSFLIADFSGNALIRFVSTPAREHIPAEDEELRTVPLAGPYEVALRSQEVCVDGTEAASRLYAPVTDRGDALGVLELSLPASPTEDVVAFVASAAHALAYVVIATRRHTDLFERGQRNVPFSLAAEIQRRLLPDAFTCEGAAFTLAGWLEPASDIGGDTFDYSVERDVLRISISDAKGHSVQAAQLATLAVGSLRNSRRTHGGVVEQAESANVALWDNATDEDFVSALVLRVDLRTGRVGIVNAGHPTPFLVREGDVAVVCLDADLPFGMLRETEYAEQFLQLHVGDRLVLLTDGMLERNAEALDIAGALAATAALHPREVVHTLAREVLGVTRGDLKDDATVLCIDWYGGEQGDGVRVATAGASQGRVSAPLE